LYPKAAARGGHPPNAPADLEEIQALESTIGAPLPRDYRQLLSWADGWQTVQGSIFLLSIQEILSGDFQDILEEIADQLKAGGYRAAWLIGYRNDEDTAYVLLIRGQSSRIVEVQQSLFI